jgi:hypothetical protein
MAKRKDVSLLVSAAGWIASFVGDLISLLRDRGVSDEQIHALVTDDLSAKKMLNKIADAIAEIIKSAKSLYVVAMNYATSIEVLVKRGKYNWSNSNITTKNFPTKYTGKSDLEIDLVHFNRIISSEDVITELDKMGLRPVEAGELLKFGIKYPDVQKDFPIVALGLVWRDLGGNREVLCLLRNGVERNASLNYFAGAWDDYYRFAATRK